MTTRPALLVQPAAASLSDAAFSAALRSAEPAHRALAGRMLGNAEDAHDALQEAWLRAWRHRGAVQAAAAVHGWLRQIVVRECLRVLRLRRLRSWLPFVDVHEPSPGPEVALVHADTWRRARAVVERLPAQQRVAWGLRFDEGWSVPEIAAALDVSPETVKTHLSRALAHVQRRMGVQDGL